MESINLIITLLFLFAAIIAISALPKTKKWKGLVAVSILFLYLLVGNKIFILLILAGITYAFGRMNLSKKSNVWACILLLLIPLVISKITYIDSHFENYKINTIHTFSLDKWRSTLFHILGLSYFTFNCISYIIDIKRKYLEPEKNFFFLLLYLFYFPTIFSGPLHRAKYLFEQFKNIEITNESVSKGLRLILWGLFKNVVIAQRLFLLITSLQTSDIGGFYYLLIGLLFFIYLYCNFSSFIDFFQGVSQILNIKLNDNFGNRIYLSSSRQEYWKGWHITLNEWFRDYFFFALIKYDKKRKYTDVFLLITFLLIALWHEFSLALLLWGTLNGLWIIIEKKIAFQKWPFESYRKFFGTIYHLIFSSLLAILFITPETTILYKKIIQTASYFPYEVIEKNKSNLIIIVLSLVIMDIHNWRAKNKRFDDYLADNPLYIRWFIYFKLTIIILLFGLGSGIQNYYIQF